MSPTAPQRVVYLSPHLDDVVWSCPGHVLDTIASGGSATVVTVFSASTGGRTEQTRKAEDRRAVDALGAELRHLDHLDAPWRTPWWPSRSPAQPRAESCTFSDIMCAAPDGTLVDEVADSLRALFDELQPDLVVAPLGVGNHLDHRTVHLAGALAAPSVSSVWYEDRPYCLIDEAVRVRLAALGLDAIGVDGGGDIDWDRYWRSFGDAIYVREFLRSPDERQRIADHLTASVASTVSGEARAIEHALPDAHLDRAEVAMLEYRSQVAAFLATDSLRELIGIERTWQRST